MFTAVADGNGNGLRTSDILGGIDTPLGPAEMLALEFPQRHIWTPAGNPRRRWLNRWWNRRRPGWRVAHRVHESERIRHVRNSLPPWPAAGAVCRPSAGGDGSCAHTQIRRR